MNDSLNVAQRRSLTIGLRAFEMHLRQADAWLRGGEERGILYRRSLNLSPEQRATARRQIAGALAQIAILAERFGLANADEDLGATIAAQMSVDWADLSERARISCGAMARWIHVWPTYSMPISVRWPHAHWPWRC